MIVYRILTVLIFLGIIGALFRATRSQTDTWAGFWSWVGNQWKQSVSTLANIRSLSFSDAMNVLRHFFYLLTALCIAIMVLSGFIPVIFLGKNLSGILLVIHATISPVFAVSIAILILLAAHQHRFVDRDWQALTAFFSEGGSATTDRDLFLRKVCFWVLALLAIPVITSVIFSMYPIYGTEGQENLLNIHRYSTLLFTIFAVLHTYLMVGAHRTAKE